MATPPVTTRPRANGASLTHPSDFLHDAVARLAEGNDPAAFVAHAVGGLVRRLGADHAFLLRYLAADNALCLHLRHDGNEVRWGPSGAEIDLFAAPFPADITPAFRLVCRARRMVTPALHSAVLGDEVPPEAFAWPGAFEYMARAGVSDSAVTVLFAGDEPLGTLHVQFTGGRRVRPEDEGDFLALARLVAVALRLGDRAAEARDAAVARERERAVERRAAELVKANDALQAVIDTLPAVGDLDQFVPAALRAVATAFGAADCAFYEHPDGEPIRLRYWFRAGRVLTPKDVLALDDERLALVRELAREFTVPDSYLGTPPRRRTRAVVLDHRAGTSVPEFDVFCLANGWDLELNVPLVVGASAEGSLVVHRVGENPFTEGEISLAETLAKQLALAMQAGRLADDAKAAAVAREREAAADRRAAELAKANDALRRGVERVAAAAGLDGVLDAFVVEAVRAADASAGAILRRGAGNEFTFATVAQGEQITKDSLAAEFVATVGEVSRRDPAGFFARTAAGEFVIVTTDELAEWYPVGAEYHRALGNVCVWHLPFRVGGRVTGYIGLAFPDHRRPDPVVRETLEALATQAALGLELSRLADADRQAAVAREREAAADRRAAELTKANAALSRSLNGLASAAGLAPFLENVLREALAASGAVSGAVFVHDPAADALRPAAFIVRGEAWDAATDPRAATYSAPVPAGTGVAWDILGGRHEVFWVDYADPPPGDWPQSKAFHDAHGHRFVVCMPMLLAGEAVGFLGLCFDESETTPPSPTRLELCRVLAQQATLALHLTRLADAAKDTAVAREREAAAERRAVGLAAANEALRRSVAQLVTHDDLGHLLGSLLTEAIAASGAASGAIFLYDPAADALQVETIILRGVPIAIATDPAVAAFSGPVPTSVGRVWHVLAHERRVFWVDYAGPPDPDDWPFAHGWHNGQGHRFVGNMPMIDGEAVVGFLGLAFDREVAAQPSPQRLAVCQSLAQQATLALRLTRLAAAAKDAAVAREREAAAERRAAELADTNAALKQTLDAVLFEPELDKVLGHVLVAITRHLRSPSSAVWLADGATGRFAAHLAYHDGRVVEVNGDAESRLGGAWGRGRDLHFKDHIRDRRPVVYQVESLKDADRRSHEFFLRQGVHTLLGIPLILGAEIVGSLTVRFDAPRDLRAEDLELSQAMAHQATMAIQLTRLADRAGQAAVLGERTRLAREIHDTVAQGLVAILMHARAAASGDDPVHHLVVMQRLAEENLTEASRAVRALRPTVAGTDGLGGSLRRLAERLSEQAGPAVRVRTRGRLPELSAGVEDELGRVAREAAANAVKHSGADEVVIELAADGPGLRLAVADAGCGFDTARVPDGRFGVVGMVERAERIGAELTIISEPGRGTTVVVAWKPGRASREGS